MKIMSLKYVDLRMLNIACGDVNMSKVIKTGFLLLSGQ